MFCHKCGTKNEDTSKYCKSCGTQLKSVNFTQTEEKTPQNKVKKDQKKIVYIIGAVIVLMAIVVAVMIGVRSKKAKEYETYLASAEKYIEELDYDQAEDFYLKAIHVAPKKLKPYVELAEVYISSGEVKKAKEIVELAEAKKAKGDGETEEKFEELIVLLEEAKDVVDYQWVVEPTIEADDIYYITEFDSYDENYEVLPLNDNYRQTYSDYAVIKREDSLGLIKHNGEIVGGLDFKEITNYGEDAYCLIRKEPIWSQEYEQDWDLYWLEDDTFRADVGVGDFWSTAFYYCDGLHEMNEYNDYSFESAIPPRIPIPVKKSEKLINDEYNNFEIWGNLPGKYGIYYDGEMKTDFIYDECGSYSDGLLAVCQDGKWGYVNQDGEIVIPLEYDASWSQFDLEWDWSLEQEGVRDYCYTATDGYVVLCKDGEWELRDTEGKLAIPSGIFEAIRPVYEGKCWVKQAGKWGVIELGKSNEEIDDSQEETLSFKELPKEFVFTSGAGGWATEMTLDSDGSFRGKYYDSNMGESDDDYPNGTMYISEFEGEFSQIEKLDENTYTVRIENIELEMDPGHEYYLNGWKYIAAEPYGLEDTNELYIYVPETRMSDLPVDVEDWLRMKDMNLSDTVPEGCYVIYNPSGAVFIGGWDY